MSGTNNDTEKQEAALLLLSAIKTATLRAKLDATELETIGIALSAGMIEIDYAVVWLRELGLVDAVIEAGS